MRIAFLSTLLAFAAAVAGNYIASISYCLGYNDLTTMQIAIEILTPSVGQKESQDKSITVKWKYVACVIRN